MTNKIKKLIFSVALLFSFCVGAFMGQAEANVNHVCPPPTLNLSYRQPLDINTLVKEEVVVKPEIEVEPQILYSQEEVDAITRTLAGECYADQSEDKRKVVQVILNRVSSKRFDDDVLSVVSAKSQFSGYWHQSRPVNDDDIKIAKELLTEWYEDDCEPLSEYLYFSAGKNRQNVFRKTF